jgi:hypothetical protein
MNINTFVIVEVVYVNTNVSIFRAGFVEYLDPIIFNNTTYHQDYYEINEYCIIYGEQTTPNECYLDCNNVYWKSAILDSCNDRVYGNTAHEYDHNKDCISICDGHYIKINQWINALQ